MPLVLAASDKFKGTATAAQICAAIARAARSCGWDVDEVPLSDGGDGLLDVLGGANRTTTVTGPLGEPVEAGWRLDGARAVVESALASGLVLVGRNRPLEATTRGTGELIEAAVSAGARSVLVGVGGSATTDGGTGALAALSDRTLADLRTGAIEVTVCCDVTTRFEDAARVFGPQKGASPSDVEVLSARLASWRVELRDRFGVDVATLEGGGAAGGLAGGLAAAGATLQPGFDLVAERVDLARRVAAADLVITGEGRLDASSLEGKVVGRVAALAGGENEKVIAVVGDAVVDASFRVISLTGRYGADRALTAPLDCVEDAVRAVLRRRAE